MVFASGVGTVGNGGMDSVADDYGIECKSGGALKIERYRNAELVVILNS